MLRNQHQCNLPKLHFFQDFSSLCGGGGAGVHLNLTNLSEADILCEERNHRGSWQVKMAHKKITLLKVEVGLAKFCEKV